MSSKKCQVIGCPVEADFYVLTEVHSLKGVRCALCREHVLATRVYSEWDLDGLEKVLPGQ